ncbi:hypothetical protein P872_04550 [Rhodonellum psychrophilum GCM71 = DSM 17998]|uniref:DUF4296 domain-containing protein n=2 Tax=Rhodonellum TaxID=336827 RepID=U5C319_9BACT|nr:MULTISPECIES: hypothetical protein [Rhodonellum]ERM82587.1 hypothetical protein P872_04550 [Rhodonellum psychrophilum GCM71 = DSM 17998]MDO9553895.1 hypothetical protein [Rhodonellum sp.]SDZ53317.1 hypothetical protein SAMN05444412_12122 [Rhodonellum ikkaensis]
MQTKIHLSVFFLILFQLVSCGTKNQEPSEILKEANVFHQKSLDLREEIMGIEKQLQNEGLDYTNLKEELKIWDKDIIEVVGYEHSDANGYHRKYHIHNPPKPLSEEEQLAYQKMMYEEILAIHEKFARLMAPEVMS